MSASCARRSRTARQPARPTASPASTTAPGTTSRSASIVTSASRSSWTGPRRGHPRTTLGSVSNSAGVRGRLRRRHSGVPGRHRRVALCTARCCHRSESRRTSPRRQSTRRRPAVTLTTPANGSSGTDTTPTFGGIAGTALGDSGTVTVKRLRRRGNGRNARPDPDGAHAGAAARTPSTRRPRSSSVCTPLRPSSRTPPATSARAPRRRSPSRPRRRTPLRPS